jgi:N-methylhydantoinase A
MSGMSVIIGNRQTKPPSSMTQQKRIRIAVDIGGTFTDLECIDEVTGTAHSFKTPTTPADPAIGLVNAITGAAARYGFAIDDISLLIHGTTIATNAVLTRRLPVCALITTAGFEDVLEIGRHARRDIYGLRPEERTVLAARRHRFGVRERMAANGSVLTPLDMPDLDRIIDAIAASGAEVLAVSLLNGYVNPAHEIAIREQLALRLPNLPRSCSHEVSPEIREFERTSTTVLNALLMPVVQTYVAGLERRTREAGLTAPVYLVQSNGGAATPAQAGRTPVNLLLSGPSGGVLAAEKVAATTGRPNIVAVDMGGTSYDIAIIREGCRSVVAQGDVDGLPVRVPMVEMRTIGAGGGSIVWLDASGRLQVGPQSAGAQPGPVCYRRGGTEPTVTDINLVLGRLEAESFLGGALSLDLNGARASLKKRIATPLGLGLEAAASGVLSIVVARLAGAIKLSLFERGLDPRDFALMSFGGAGGLHAIDVAEELGVREVVFPAEPSTFSAHGILQSDIVHDLARASIIPLKQGNLPQIRHIVQELQASGNALLDADRLPADRRALRLAADLRYRGQAFELMVAVELDDLTDIGMEGLIERFHTAHKQRFSFDDRGETVELVTLRLSALGLITSGAAQTAQESGVLVSPEPKGSRAIFMEGAWREAPVFKQVNLPAGAHLGGPAIIEQPYTTLVINKGWRLTRLPSGDLIAAKDVA